MLAGELGKEGGLAPEEGAELIVPMLLMLIHSVCALEWQRSRQKTDRFLL
jgi:hypothetical protein